MGVQDGFYKNLDVKIPLPKSLKSVARVASFAGYGDRVDAFELSMNRAAEKAVPVAVDVFVDAIKQMSFSEKIKENKDESAIILAKKEFELLCLLASKPGKVFTREEIFNKVWGTDVIVNDRTIDVHIRKLREKIGNKYIKTIKGIGYKFEL